MIVRLVAIAMLALSVAHALAEVPESLSPIEVDSAFVNGQYERVELLALRILQSDAQITADERARLHLTAGYALIMLGREAEARGHFGQALDAVPELTLDPVQVSPKFRVIFDEVKAARPQRVSTPPSALTQLDSAGATSARHSAKRALISNLIVPGSGQWREGRRLRGLLFFSVEATAAGVLVWRIGETRDSHERYLAETNLDQVREAYDDYNRDYRAAWAAGIAAGVVYLVAQVDLIRIVESDVKKRDGVGFHVQPWGGGIEVCFRW